MRGPRALGREKGGALALPQLGTPSRLIVFEDPPGEVADLTQEERALQGRLEPFGPKAIFNPRLRPATNRTAFLWERNPSMPGYRALVERPMEVSIAGQSPTGAPVDYVAKGWEARLAQQAVDVLDGVFFTDRCVMRSLRHLDARDDPLPPKCPAVGPTGTPSQALSEAEIAASAERGGSRGFLAGVPGLGRPNVLLVGSLLLRLRAREVPPGAVTGEAAEVARELREALASGKHPLGIAAPQLGRRMRAIAVGEMEEAVEKLTARSRVAEEHRAFAPLVLFNPVLRRKAGTPDTFFFERSTSIPGYEAVVGRALEVEVEALGEGGEAVSFTARGWQARLLQHTVDVLDGVMYVDRMERRSFRRDTIGDELPEGVPFGVRPVTKKLARPRAGGEATKARAAAPRARSVRQRR
mmetsp:Transcript_62971/g.178918  ORF Transcript_62971/g.178918 Transcript_62971/m.178918 type:complete len:412 (+) Transcript_62971:143-1378(+)